MEAQTDGSPCSGLRASSRKVEASAVHPQVRPMGLQGRRPTALL